MAQSRLVSNASRYAKQADHAEIAAERLKAQAPASILPHSVGFDKLIAALGPGLIGAAGAGDYEALGLTDGLTITGSDLGLGAITPDSVAAAGPVSATGATFLTAEIFAQYTGPQTGALTANFAAYCAYKPNAAGRRLGSYLFEANDNVGAAASAAGIHAFSGAAWGAADTSAYLRFDVTPVGSIVTAEAMRLTSAALTLVAGVALIINGVTVVDGAGAIQPGALPTFTAALKGAVGASGGGVVNFLRADGAWAPPPAGGGGVADADYGDVLVSGAGTVWTVQGSAGAFAAAGAISAAGTISATSAIAAIGATSADAEIYTQYTGAATGGLTANFEAYSAYKPTAVNQRIGSYLFAAKDNGGAAAAAASIHAFSGAAWGAADTSSYIRFDVTPVGSVVTAEIARLIGGVGLLVAGSILSNSASLGVGYAAGAGAAIAQITNKSTGVTINNVTGQITMNAAALAAGAIVEFIVTNSRVAATDTINLNLAAGAATSTAYRYWISRVGAGSFRVCVENRSAGSLSEALVFNFAVVKGVNS